MTSTARVECGKGDQYGERLVLFQTGGHQHVVKNMHAPAFSASRTCGNNEARCVLPSIFKGPVTNESPIAQIHSATEHHHQRGANLIHKPNGGTDIVTIVHEAYDETAAGASKAYRSAVCTAATAATKIPTNIAMAPARGITRLFEAFIDLLPALRSDPGACELARDFTKLCLVHPTRGKAIGQSSAPT